MKVNWKARCDELEDSMAQQANDARNRLNHNTREIEGLLNQVETWRTLAMSLCAALTQSAADKYTR